MPILSILALPSLKTPAVLKARGGLEWLDLVVPCQRGCPSSVRNHRPEKAIFNVTIRLKPTNRDNSYPLNPH